MERLRQNVAANAVGIALASGVPLLFNILYYRLLGSDAYGLVGLYVTAQMIAVAVEAGLHRATTREVAREAARAGGEMRVRSVVLTLLTASAALFLALAVIVGASASWIATEWLNAGAIDRDTVTRAVALIGLSVALQQPRSILLASLNGLHRQMLTNVLISGAAILRGVVTVAALAAAPQVDVFFMTQVVMAAVETLSVGAIIWRVLPASAGTTRARLDWTVLRNVRAFALADGATGTMGALIVNADKLLLSGLVSLPVFGSYALLSLVAQALARLPTPFTIAHFPSFVELRERGDAVALADVYRRANVGLTTILVPAAITAVMFAAPIAAILLGGTTDLHSPHLIFALLCLAFTSNALLHLPYTLQLASGWTRLSFIMNVIVLATYVPLLSRFVPREGPLAAALLFSLAMAIPFPVAAHLTHHRLLPRERGAWWRIAVATPVALSILVIAPARLLSSSLSPWPSVIVATVAGLAALAAVRSVQQRVLRGAQDRLHEGA